jgi:hypothetical protein
VATIRGLKAGISTHSDGSHKPAHRLWITFSSQKYFPIFFLLLRQHVSPCFIFLLSLALTSQGCSFSYVDSQGYKHVMGLVDVKMKISPSDPNPDRAENIDVTSVGISFYTNPLNSGLAIGYNQESVTVLNGSNCIAVPDNSNQGDTLKTLTDQQMIQAFERIANENY